jgi:asparagine synthase (glutamine-hydrolysing)
MCGISGYFSAKPFFNEADLDTMIGAQHHRGPDSSGKFVEGPVALGHNRLSIIDLSERGAQPMTSHDGRYVIVYNGEIYNYNEIAAQLRYSFNPEIQFQSSSDTEVILQAFANYGIDSIKHFNGMFAFAIYDKQKEELYVVRDRVGIKPLYYYWNGEHFAFSSEIKTLKRVQRLQLKIDYTVIPQYLHLGYIPTPFSIYENCYKLEQGTYMKISKQGVECHSYWSIPEAISENTVKNEKQAIIQVSDLLASSVQYQLKSDVPYGVFLSGGIDSSLVAQNAVNLSGTRINTFSIGFENQKFNEAVYAKKVADYLGTNHHEFTVTVNDAIDALDDYMNTYGEPFADSSGIPTLMVSKLAKKYVTVVLSGEGGDELFHGYGAYRWAQRLANPLIFYNRGLIRKMLSRSSSERNERAAGMFDLKDQQQIRSHIFSREQYFFSRAEITELLEDQLFSAARIEKLVNYTNEVFNEKFSEKKVKRRLLPQEKQSLYDMQFYLPDNLLVKVDRASMHYSLETRVPYLDHRLVEQAINIHTNLKDKPVPKYILKEILYQYIPKDFFDRPKQGFSIPMKDWLNKEMSFLIDDYLNETVVKKVGLFRFSEVDQLVKRFRAGKGYLSQRLWLLITLHRWFIKNEA